MIIVYILVGILVSYFVIGGIAACMLSSKISQDEEKMKIEIRK